MDGPSTVLAPIWQPLLQMFAWFCGAGTSKKKKINTKIPKARSPPAGRIVQGCSVHMEVHVMSNCCSECEMKVFWQSIPAFGATRREAEGSGDWVLPDMVLWSKEKVNKWGR